MAPTYDAATRGGVRPERVAHCDASPGGADGGLEAGAVAAVGCGAWDHGLTRAMRRRPEGLGHCLAWALEVGDSASSITESSGERGACMSRQNARSLTN
jgi:hypothetical protein